MQEKLHITPELIEEFLAARRAEGLAETSISSYERMLLRLYALLPEDKILRPGMLRELVEKLRVQGYAPRTLNVFLAAAESLIKYGGLNIPSLEREQTETAETPEISRSEYLKLLAAAKQMDKPQVYYLVKCFAILGINLRDVPQVTLEATEAGLFQSSEGVVRIPQELRRELLRYAKAEGIGTGPLFRGRDGEPMHRTNINKSIVAVGSRTKIPPERYSPKALRKLHERTQEELVGKMQFLLEREYDRMLAEENLTTGWYYS